MKNYSWKISSLFKGIDPEVAAKELKRIKKKYGRLTPENIVEESGVKNSPLFKYFEWNNEKAAYNYRLQQARTLLNNIEITIVKDGDNILLPVYEVIEAKGYVDVTTITYDEMEIVKANALRDLNYIKNKILNFDKLNCAIPKIEEAIDYLKTA